MKGKRSINQHMYITSEFKLSDFGHAPNLSLGLRSGVLYFI